MSLVRLDATALRADFPILEQTVHGHRLVYLDSAATSQKPVSVIDAISRFYREINANVHRGVHTLGDRATDAYEGARERVARFIGAPTRRSVIFTRNTTEAINLFARTWGRAHLRPGDEIVTTELEHHSNLVPWQMCAAATGAVLRVVPVGEDGVLDLDRLCEAIGARTKLVAVTHCSNVTGAIHDLERVVHHAHDRGALVLADTAQSAPHLPLDVAKLGVDVVAFSAHKMCGPTGIGVLWARPEILADAPPFLGGGSMIHEVWPDRSTWAEIPARLEAGTPNIADAVAFVAALDYLEGTGRAAIRAHERALVAETMARLVALPWVRVYGPADPTDRSGVVAFNVFADPRDAESLIHPHDVGTLLDARGIAIRVGNHCCQPLMRRLDVPATARASFYLYNDESDVDALIDGLHAARKTFLR
ncbi:MAG: cysteine desulfurase [Chloroflexi bacterium]|nr:cysteine desulfurase [Chloroflexota bacterium]